jgi:hypothetical protein
MIILSQTETTDGYHGTVGTPTNMCDSNGNPLFVGDIVTMYHKDYPDKVVGFVCEENHQYAHWTNNEQQYVMGIADVWNSIKFNSISESIYDDAILEHINNISEGWIIKKVKDFAELMVGEHWGFIYVRDIN